MRAAAPGWRVCRRRQRLLAKVHTRSLEGRARPLAPPLKMLREQVMVRGICDASTIAQTLIGNASLMLLYHYACAGGILIAVRGGSSEEDCRYLRVPVGFNAKQLVKHLMQHYRDTQPPTVPNTPWSSIYPDLFWKVDVANNEYEYIRIREKWSEEVVLEDGVCLEMTYIGHA